MKVNNTFHFQVKDSPAPLNIPIPTPAPDWGGPVAWVSGIDTKGSISCLFENIDPIFNILNLIS